MEYAVLQEQQQLYFLRHIMRESKWQQLHFFTSYHKGVREDKKLNIVRCEELQGWWIKFIICCRLQWWRQQACIARRNDNDNIFYVIVLHNTVYPGKGTQDHATLQPTLSIDVGATMTIAKVPKSPWYTNVCACHCREWEGQFFYVVLQGTMAMIDCNEGTQDCISNNQIFDQCINHINDCKDARCQQYK